MKRLILTKQFYSTDVAHLYEHLFCTALNNLFIEKEVFQYVDYSLVAKTHHPGIIILDLELYTEKAYKASKHVSNLTISPKRSEILLTISQISAEEEKPLFITDFEDLKNELQSLNTIEWVSLDELNWFDALEHKEDEEGAFYVAIGEPQPANRLSLALSVNHTFINHHRELLPLFYELSQMIIDNLQITLASRFGCYSFDDAIQQEKTKLSRVNYFKVSPHSTVSFELAQIERVVQHMVSLLISTGSFEQFIRSLHVAPFSSIPNLMPNFEQILSDTRVLIGQAGWKTIATSENIRLILSSTILDLELESQFLSTQVLPKK